MTNDIVTMIYKVGQTTSHSINFGEPHRDNFDEPTREEVLEGKLYDLFRGAALYKANIDQINDVFFHNLLSWNDWHTRLINAVSKNMKNSNRVVNWASTNRQLGVYAPIDSELASLLRITINIHHCHINLFDVYTKLVEEQDEHILACPDQTDNLAQAQKGAEIMTTAIRDYIDLKE